VPRPLSEAGQAGRLGVAERLGRGRAARPVCRRRRARAAAGSAANAVAARTPAASRTSSSQRGMPPTGMVTRPGAARLPRLAWLPGTDWLTGAVGWLADWRPDGTGAWCVGTAGWPLPADARVGAWCGRLPPDGAGAGALAGTGAVDGGVP